MTHRHITCTLLLLASVLMASAQALTERYNNRRPVVVALDNIHPPFSFINYVNEPSGSGVAIVKAVTESLGLPCQIMMRSMTEARQAFERGEADILLTDSRSFNNPAYFASKNVINFRHASADSVAETRFMGKDHQLVEQLDDEYTRLKETGAISLIKDRWEHPDKALPEAEPIALYVALALLGLAFAVLLATLIYMFTIRQTRRHVNVLGEMVRLAPVVEHAYDVEDNQAAHDLIHKYNAILSNPFVAISFFDHNGRLIMKNELMRELHITDTTSLRQPLYNAAGEATNYFVAMRPPKSAT